MEFVLRSLGRSGRSDGGGADCLDRAERRGMTVFEAKLLENVGEVLLGREVTHAQDGPHLHVGLALSHPEEHFCFAGREAEGLQRRWRGEVGLEADFPDALLEAPLLFLLAAEPGVDRCNQLVLDLAWSGSRPRR